MEPLGSMSVATTHVTFDRHDRGKIVSVPEFLSAVLNLRHAEANQKLWYRGHPSWDYKLLPTIGRELSYAGQKVLVRREREIALLHRFRRRAYPYVGRIITVGEAIFLARHHGLPTRLLDWTANSLFALYFACVSEREELHGQDGRVWAMARQAGSGEHEIDAFQLAGFPDEAALFKFLFPNSDDVIRIIHPFYNSPRLVAQDGAFTVHSEPDVPLENFAGRTFRYGNLDIGALYSWIIPGERKTMIIKQLSGLGITHRIVFPDLDGVARSLWETEVLWSPDPPAPE
jgi:hypothetical protein